MTLNSNEDIAGRIKNGKPEDKTQIKKLELVKQEQFTILCLTQQKGRDYPEALENAKVIILQHSV